DLEAVIFRLALAIFIDREPVLDRPGRRLKDEVGEAAVVKAALDVDWPRRAMDAELDAVALLQLEIGIANQELLAAAMRTVGEQLVDPGRAFAVRQRQSRAPPGGKFVVRTKRA